MRIRLVSRNAVREVDDSCRPLAHDDSWSDGDGRVAAAAVQAGSTVG